MTVTRNPNAFDSILIVAFGGPPTGSEAYAFVKGIVGDRPAGEERIREVAGHYEHLGGSPFNKLTFEQAEALQAELKTRGIDAPVLCGFRHWAPWVKDVVAEMVQSGKRKTLGLIMAPHQCWVSWDWYKDTVTAANQVIEQPLTLTYTDPWWLQGGYVDASAERIQDSFKALGDQAAGARLVFTAHSIPINMCAQCKSGERKCPYSPQFEDSAKAIAAKAGISSYEISYQSQASTRGQWTQPDINAKIRDLSAQGVKAVVLAPIGFLCDHVEVLYDLDIEARKTAAELGMGFERAGTVGAHPAFVKMLADRVQERFDGAPRLIGDLVLS